MNNSKIPVTIITGFLGAGKTTLIQHLLKNAKGKRIALIINEFGDLGVDREFLKGCGDETCSEDDMVELANGCICCTVADEFIPTMTMLLNRAQRPDHIIVETSGLALPQPLVRAFNWPEISTEVTIDGVLTLADAAALSAGRFAADEQALDQQRKSDDMLDHETPLGELFEDQLVCADMVIVTKSDLVNTEQLDAVEKQLHSEMRPGTSLVRTAHGVIDPNIILGLALASEAHLEGRDSHHELAHDGHVHEHDDFDSFSIDLGEFASKTALENHLTEIIRTHDILRLKGFAAISGASARLAVQAVGPRITTWFDRPWNDGEQVQTRLVVIGQTPLDHSAISQSLAA